MERNNNNGLPFVRIATSKALGTQLQKEESELKLIQKLINTASSRFLKQRTTYLCLVGEPDLDLQLFTWDLKTGVVNNVTATFLDSTDSYEQGYTLFKMTFKTKSMPLIMVWYSHGKHVLYYALFFLEVAPQHIALDDTMRYIALTYYGGEMPCTDLGLHLTDGAAEWPDVLQHHEQQQMDVEHNNTNIVPVVGDPRVYLDGQPQPHTHRANFPPLIVRIVATELGRKWTWQAYVLDAHGARIFETEEHYMRGGQATNSVITRCKAFAYSTWPNNKIAFQVTIQPRRKDQLKQTGQKFLDSVTAWFGNTKSTELVLQGENAASDPNSITITAFTLEYPQTPQHACCIALVCDDEHQIAFELREANVDQLLAAATKRVLETLPHVRCNVELQFKKPVEGRQYATDLLQAGTEQSRGIAGKLDSLINWFRN